MKFSKRMFNCIIYNRKSLQISIMLSFTLNYERIHFSAFDVILLKELGKQSISRPHTKTYTITAKQYKTGKIKTPIKADLV